MEEFSFSGGCFSSDDNCASDDEFLLDVSSLVSLFSGYTLACRNIYLFSVNSSNSTGTSSLLFELLKEQFAREGSTADFFCGNLSSNGVIFVWKIPVVSNPDTKFAVIVGNNLHHKRFNNSGNKSLLSVALFWPSFDCFQSRKISYQKPFSGQYTATSRGWHQLAELGGRQINLILREMHKFTTCGLIWNERLFPIIADAPSSVLLFGRKWNLNQSLKVTKLNEPLFDLLYLVPGGPFVCYDVHRWSAL